MGLPETLSELFETTASAIEAVFANKRYRFDPEDWHRPSARLTYVSYAGCVMAAVLDCPDVRHACPADYPDAYEKLKAIETGKSGLLRRAVRLLGCNPGDLQDCDPVPEQPELAPAWFREVAKVLKKVKL